MKNISILGVSGSIGMQAIDVIRQHPNDFCLKAISVKNNIDCLNEIINEFDSIEIVSIDNPDDLDKVKFNNVFTSTEGLIKCATYNCVDIVLTAVVGFVGLIPTIEAIKANKDIALANKETLVCAGHIIMPLAKQHNINIIPVDSEHSAIFQCLQNQNSNFLNKIILTASGGSFRDKSRAELNQVSVKDALNHPNWKMGKKITIDSATMYNKGLEIIEAHHLFNIDYDKIEVIIHKQSIIHSMIEYNDTSVIAQLGNADMRVPISYALHYPVRKNSENIKSLNLAEISRLDFSNPDFERYPSLKNSFMAGKKGHSYPTVLNAANEVCVDLFLNEVITFTMIDEIITEVLKEHKIITNPDLDEIIKLDKSIRDYVYTKWSSNE